MHIGPYHVSRISPRPRRISYRRINVFGAAVSHVSRINVLAYSRIHVSTYHVLTYHVSAYHVLTSSRICVSRISMCLPLAIACLPIAMLWPGLAIARPRPWPQQWQWVCQWPQHVRETKKGEGWGQGGEGENATTCMNRCANSFVTRLR